MAGSADPMPGYRFDFLYDQRGAVVEWLEQLDYSAESSRKVNSRLGFAMRQLKNSLCRPSSDLWKTMAAKGGGWAPPFINCAQDTVRLTPTASTAIRLWETFTFTF